MSSKMLACHSVAPTPTYCKVGWKTTVRHISAMVSVLDNMVMQLEAFGDQHRQMPLL
jgi:hypothetical protein